MSKSINNNEPKLPSDKIVQDGLIAVAVGFIGFVLAAAFCNGNHRPWREPLWGVCVIIMLGGLALVLVNWKDCLAASREATEETA